MSQTVFSRLIRAALLTAALIASGCLNRPRPSEQYAQAHQLFTKVYASRLDDAFADPAMAQVEALLLQVPQDSADWRPAKDLARRIEEGRKRLLEAEAARRSAAAQVNAPVPYQRMSFEAAPVSTAAAEVDAGSAQPVQHMPLSEFTDRFSPCFRQGEKITVVGKGLFDSWELKDIANCRDRHPGFDQLYVLTDSKEIFLTVAKNLVTYQTADAGSRPSEATAASAR